jgi:hypothetical protein
MIVIFFIKQTTKQLTNNSQTTHKPNTNRTLTLSTEQDGLL